MTTGCTLTLSVHSHWYCSQCQSSKLQGEENGSYKVYTCEGEASSVDENAVAGSSLSARGSQS